MAINENRPLYLQLADELMDRIVAGEFAADERVPSVREFAARSEVNTNTAVRSYEQLERMGVIYNKRGLGYFVSPNAGERIVALRREEFFGTEMNYIFSRLHTMGITPDELRKFYDEFLQTKKFS
jgi:DNA-binding transcriptional regulator YhcF (GntR family)